MPYRRRGRKVYVKKGKRWKLKATAKSVANAKRMIKKLRMIKHKKK